MPVPASTLMPQCDALEAEERQRRRGVKQASVQATLKSIQPFSFAEEDQVGALLSCQSVRVRLFLFLLREASERASDADVHSAV
jgi:hypothetical protein